MSMEDVYDDFFSFNLCMVNTLSVEGSFCLFIVSLFLLGNEFMAILGDRVQ